MGLNLKSVLRISLSMLRLEISSHLKKWEIEGLIWIKPRIWTILVKRLLFMSLRKMVIMTSSNSLSNKKKTKNHTKKKTTKKKKKKKKNLKIRILLKSILWIHKVKLLWIWLRKAYYKILVTRIFIFVMKSWNNKKVSKDNFLYKNRKNLNKKSLWN